MKIITLTLGALAVNTYIVFTEGSKECAVIDPADGFEALDSELQKNSLIPSGIILTHSHFDHTSSLKQLKKKYSCPIYLHRDEAEMLADSVKNLSAHYGNEPIEISNPEKLLEDGDTFELAGLFFDVLHTPGHSVGSAVYKCENVLFTGDTLFNGCCGRCDFWGGDTSQMRNSLDRLFTLDNSFKVLPGHGEATTIGAQRSYYKYFI